MVRLVLPPLSTSSGWPSVSKMMTFLGVPWRAGSDERLLLSMFNRYRAAPLMAPARWVPNFPWFDAGMQFRPLTMVLAALSVFVVVPVT